MTITREILEFICVENGRVSIRLIPVQLQWRRARAALELLPSLLCEKDYIYIYKTTEFLMFVSVNFPVVTNQVWAKVLQPEKLEKYMISWQNIDIYLKNCLQL